MKDLERIIKFCAAQKRDAQEQLYAYSYLHLGRSLSPYIKDESQRDWFFNLGMLKVFKSLDRYKKNTNYLGWARTIIIRTAIDHIRSNKSYSGSLAPVTEETIQRIPDDLENALNALAYEDLLKVVQDLPDRERIVFNLYELEGYNHREIQEVAGIKKNTSKWLLANAKRNLRNNIQGIEPSNRQKLWKIKDLENA